MIFRIINRLVTDFVQAYRKNVFLDRIGSKEKSLILNGRVNLNASNVKIGKNVVLYDGISIYGGGEIIIGDNVKIGKDTYIYASKKGGIYIGNNTSIAAQCYIIDCNHGIKKNMLIMDQELEAEPVFIGNDVWIGAGVKVIKGSKIHDGAVVGALSLVNSKIDEYKIAVGIPAKVIKERI